MVRRLLHGDRRAQPFKYHTLIGAHAPTPLMLKLRPKLIPILILTMEF